MTKRHPSPSDDQWLASLLRSAAEAERPEFSPMLHDRIVAQIGGEGLTFKAGRSPGKRSGHPAGRRFLLGVCLGGVCALLLVGLIWISGRRQAGDVPLAQTMGRDAPTTHSVGMVSEISEQDAGVSGSRVQRGLDAPPERILATLAAAPHVTFQQVRVAAEELEEQQWASLDQDLVKAGEILKNQLPLNLVAQIRKPQKMAPPGP